MYGLDGSVLNFKEREGGQKYKSEGIIALMLCRSSDIG